MQSKSATNNLTTQPESCTLLYKSVIQKKKVGSDVSKITQGFNYIKSRLYEDSRE
jgi:hypothetical protein